MTAFEEIDAKLDQVIALAHQRNRELYALRDAANNAADFLNSVFGPVSHDLGVGWSDDDAETAYHKLRAAIDASALIEAAKES